MTYQSVNPYDGKTLKIFEQLTDEQLEARFWTLAGEIVEPLVELARTHTSPSIERSVLMRMGLDSRTCMAVVSECETRGLLGPGMKMFGIVHDDPDVTPEDKIRYDAAVAVSRPVSPEGEFGVMELAGGRYAVATHRGPYE